jgi:hypothetical protein
MNNNLFGHNIQSTYVLIVLRQTSIDRNGFAVQI